MIASGVLFDICNYPDAYIKATKIDYQVVELQRNLL